MKSTHAAAIAAELGIKPAQVGSVADLIAEGSTVPFIARYRKEATGSLDETVIRVVRDRITQLEELDKRREAILKSLEERDLLTDELKNAVEGAKTMTGLEDIYLPYRPKRRTRATIAREKGLDPLAGALMEAAAGKGEPMEPLVAAEAFIDEEKGVATAEEALAGARDIIAEDVSENAPARSALRFLFVKRGKMQSRVAKGKETEGATYRDYFDWAESARNAPSHRVLAMFRGEKEGMLTLSVTPPTEEAVEMLCKRFISVSGAAADHVRMAIEDGYKRLAGPSMETEIRNALKNRSDKMAVGIFADNLETLLLAPPMGRKSVLAVDPGVRTGCKLVVLDPQGELLANDVIYPFSGKNALEKSREKVLEITGRFPIEAVAIGNGTAGRETEAFFREMEIPGDPIVVMVNESGASVYSASDVAREEFPDYDVTVRGAVSIGRRLQDPLAELVKIEPKSIGVGQYQHDVDQKMLKGGLDDVVVSCVNRVGVEVNTASRQLLSYVSGLGTSLASNVLEFRRSEGPFRSRNDFKKVPRLGPKAFEQSAGFLRILGGDHPLDSSAVHPEHYHIVEKMAADLDCSVADLMNDEELRKKIDPARYVCEEAGLPTLKDIMDELAKPGRDPREAFAPPAFSPDVHTMDDLEPGMELEGVATNVTAFGAFVDVGVHQDGLVHISHLADKFVKNPGDVIKPGQQVRVKVLEVDKQRKRISLSMKGVDQKR